MMMMMMMMMMMIINICVISSISGSRALQESGERVLALDVEVSYTYACVVVVVGSPPPPLPPLPPPPPPPPPLRPHFCWCHRRSSRSSVCRSS